MVLALLKQLKAKLPKPLQRLLWQIKSWPRWWQIWRAPRVSVLQVYYGHDTLPPLYARSHGGVVKFQHLQSALPNTPRGFNLLYMVSSYCPGDAVTLARLTQHRGGKFVWNQNGVAYPAWQSQGWEAINQRMSKLLHRADLVFYQSEFCKFSADHFLGSRQGPWQILHNAVDTQIFTPALQVPDPEYLVLILGGTQYQKYRLVTALETTAFLKQQGVAVRLIVTGRLCWPPSEAHSVEEAHRVVKALGIEDEVTFFGAYTQQQAPDILRQAHILLHTKYNDPSPGLVLEAMACGLPVVYSQTGGVPELVGSQAGVGIPGPLSWTEDHPPSPELLARAVMTVYEDLSTYTVAARQRAVDNFDIQPWRKKQQSIFEQLLSGP